GRYALVLCLVGYAVGLAKPDTGQLRSAVMPMVAVAGAAIGSTVLYAGIGALVGDTAARHVGLAKLLFTATVYDLLLAPFTVPWIMALARRLDNDPVANDAGGPGFGPYRWISAGTPRPTRTGRSGRLNRPRVGGGR